MTEEVHQRSLVLDHVIWAIMKRGTMQVASLWADRDSAEEQQSREQRKYKILDVDDQFEIVQLSVERYV